MEFLKKVQKWFGKKLTVAAVGMILMAVKSSHPDWPIPSEEFVRDVILAFLGAHTVSDVVAILKTTGNEVLEGRAK